MSRVTSRVPGLSTFLIALVVLIVIVLACYEITPVNRAITYGYEDVAYAINPTAERAMDYGVRHFNAEDSSDYDINRAKYFFDLVAEKDASYPYLFHELARISFLQGNLHEALSQIDIQIEMHGDSEPDAYYVKGLIEGYLGDYADSATDYAHFIQFEPNNWAAKNDESWALIKDRDYQQALQVINSGLTDASQNAWLLNSKATVLYELGDYTDALQAVQQASVAVSYLTPAQWSIAYPGNDPAIANEGLDTFKAAVADNMHTIQIAIASSTVHSK